MAKDQSNESEENGGSRAEQLKREAAKAAETARAKAGEAIHEIQVASNQLVDRVRDLIEEGNVRRIVIKRGDKTLLEIPLTIGVGAGAAAVLFSPILAAVGALAALVSEITLVVERTDGEEDGEAEGSGSSGSEAASGSTGTSSGSGGSGSGGDAGSGKGGDKTVGRSSGSSDSDA